jgi:hypothetical protein
VPSGGEIIEGRKRRDRSFVRTAEKGFDFMNETPESVESPSREETGLSSLIALINKTKSVLDDPHPGLFIWEITLQDYLQQIEEWHR